MRDVIQIGRRSIGAGRPVFIIAEAGVNHNGDLKRAFKLVDAAAKAGADAVKFQTFSTDRLVTSRSPKAKYQRKTTKAGESQHAMLKKLELSRDDHRALKLRAEKHGLLFLSTPFDRESADLLEKLGVSASKVGSGELTDLPLLKHIAGKGRPMLISTGMSWPKEVAQAVRTVREAGLNEIALLHCVSAYPAPVEDVNLLAMDAMRRTFNVPVGYSDHTEGIQVAVLAVAGGACIIEKHLTLDRKLPGPDHRMSLEPKEFAAMVRNIRETEKILGNGVKQPMRSEWDTRSVARKSVVALMDIKKGRPLTRAMIGVRRPGIGIPPAGLESLLGCTLKVNVKAGAVLFAELLNE
ncbi:MAG: N-acetylneuraminate synthase [Nitrospirae bacterium]|nr:MAG: N-acetylneuraminate synthase [Nitrospirota bacterium]